MPNLLGSNMKMEFMLFKDGDMTAPYRDLYLRVNVTGPGKGFPRAYSILY
jgi:uncharacterized membrane protein